MRMSIVGFDGIFWGVILVREIKRNFNFAVFLCQEHQRKEKKRKIKFFFSLKFENYFFFSFFF